ncbi:hypothetical protein ABN584_13600 [Gloeocapsa sp. BRSZ]
MRSPTQVWHNNIDLHCRLQCGVKRRSRIITHQLNTRILSCSAPPHWLIVA